MPDLQAHSPAMGQKDGEKWTAAANLQPTLPKSGRLLGARWTSDAKYRSMYSTTPNRHADLCATAARLVVEEGLEFGAAKQRAARLLGLGPRGAMPGNDDLERAVRDYIALFCADTQPGELRALRVLACSWMRRLGAFRPHLSGAVWQGTATRLSDVHIDLFCDDTKSAELLLIDQRADYEQRSRRGMRGDMVDTLSVHSMCEGLGEMVGVHLLVYDHDQLRGALRADAHGRIARGDLTSVLALMQGH